jgi:hypothetical protein
MQPPGGQCNVTKNIKGLMKALHQSVNEAILESADVAAAMAALKRTGKCPVFTIDISMQDAPSTSDAAPETPRPDPQTDVTEQLICVEDKLAFSDSDISFLAALGIGDPTW